MKTFRAYVVPSFDSAMALLQDPHFPGAIPLGIVLADKPNGKPEHDEKPSKPDDEKK